MIRQLALVINLSQIISSLIKLLKTFILKAHIDVILPKLCAACYSFIAIKPLSQENLRLMYCSYSSHITHGIIFWVSSSHSIHVFRLQKRIIRITTGSKLEDNCRQFKNLRILSFQSKYPYSFVMFVAKNIGTFITTILRDIFYILLLFIPILC